MIVFGANVLLTTLTATAALAVISTGFSEVSRDEGEIIRLTLLPMLLYQGLLGCLAGG